MFPFDLHVLGLPPAFNLSHDQTLQFNDFLPQSGIDRRQAGNGKPPLLLQSMSSRGKAYVVNPTSTFKSKAQTQFEIKNY